jgi:4-hydroxy-2-oxoglutarate aldolase
VLPVLCVELYDAVRTGAHEHARAVQQQLLAPASILVSKYGVAGLKYSLDRLGYYGGPPRGPLLPVNESARREIDGVLATTAAAIGR